MNPRGTAEKFEKGFHKACVGVLLLTWIRGLALVQAYLVKGPHGGVTFTSR